MNNFKVYDVMNGVNKLFRNDLSRVALRKMFRFKIHVVGNERNVAVERAKFRSALLGTWTAREKRQR